MEPQGPKLAEGRDGIIYEHGPGRVLRVVGDGRNLEDEARVMTYVRERGVPVPAVHDAGDGFVVMDRIDGPPMFAQATAPPFPIRRAEPDDLRGLEAIAVPAFRRMIVHWFVRATGDRRGALVQLPKAAERRFWDRNMKPVERERLVALAEWAASVTRS